MRIKVRPHIKVKPPSLSAQFFSHLGWIDRKPLPQVIEPYRQKIFDEALAFGSDGRRRYNRVLTGRGKKNWKTTDLVLAGAFTFFVPNLPGGNDCAVIANDEGQADDDFDLLKKVIRANPVLSREVTILQKEIVRKDGRGSFVVLPARDVVSLHGKTFAFIGFDEIHGYKNYDIFEALAPDPTRDVLEWIASYASIFNSPGYPLFDFTATGKRGDDPRMFFSWYSGDYCTDPALQDAEPEARANPSMQSWGNPGYLAQQKRRLPSHKYRRLHLNFPGMPDGSFYDAERLLACVAEGRRHVKPQTDVHYVAFVDMSGGSNDDATFAIAHFDAITKRGVLDLVMSQTGKPPFNPRDASLKFATTAKEYGIFQVTGDRYAGETFRADFQTAGVGYQVCELTKHQLYEALEPRINAGELELLDVPKLQEQLLGLVGKRGKIDHLPGEHDDWANAAAGAVYLTRAGMPITAEGFMAPDPDECREADEQHSAELEREALREQWPPLDGGKRRDF